MPDELDSIPAHVGRVAQGELIARYDGSLEFDSPAIDDRTLSLDAVGPLDVDVSFVGSRAGAASGVVGCGAERTTID